MSYKDQHDVLYQACFENYRKGHALYKAVSSTKLKPGICGYFDSDGDWQVIADLTMSDEDLKKEGWGDPGNIEVNPDDNQGIWGPKYSQEVIDFPVSIDAQANIPNTPVALGFGIKHGSRQETGAVLVTDGDVTHDQITPLSSTKAKNWLVINARAILDKYEKTRTKGIFIVTKTYHAKQRGVALLRSKETEITISLNVELAAIGTLTPSASWWTASKEKEWEVHKHDEGIVVFMSGWFWRPHWYTKKVKPTDVTAEQNKLLGEDKDAGKMTFQFRKDDSLMEIVELTPEPVGETDA